MSLNGPGDVFKDPVKLKEMLDLRRAAGPDSSYHSLAEKYTVSHSSILYHCRKAGLMPFEDQEVLADMLVYAQTGTCYTELAEKYKVHPNVILHYCHRAGVTPVHPARDLDPKAPNQRPVDIRPGWRRDQDGQWINLGMNDDVWRKHKSDKKKRQLEATRKQLLTY